MRYGYQRIHVLLQREGWSINHKKVHRIYCEEGLNLRRKRPKRHVSGAHRQERVVTSTLNECWSMDFVSDNLFNGRRIRALTIVDNFSRECLAIHVGQGIRGEEVVSVLEGLKVVENRLPKCIRIDNGPEFISTGLTKNSYLKPKDHARIRNFSNV